MNRNLMQVVGNSSDNGRLSPAAIIRRNVNNVVQPLLTDLYQITMAYAYWKSGKKDAKATFDLFFRKNPFQGEFTIFAGLDECLIFLQNFNYTEDDIDYLKTLLPKSTEPEFFEYLLGVDGKDLTFYAIPEGSVVFPKVPLIRIEGPLPICQLLETTLLTLVNYASLVTTNAARYRLASQATGDNIQLLEFGLRRAQGPDGGLSASKYAYMGGFDATSNVLAGKIYGLPVKGTHAHAFVMSYKSMDELPITKLKHRDTDEELEFLGCCQKWQKEVSELFNVLQDSASPGELAAFIAYAIAFPDAFLALIDTYDVVRSGIVNFCAVALALNELGYRPVGVRIDSGDLAYLSQVVYNIYEKIAEKYNLPWFLKLAIVASNDINEDTIISLKEQGHKINYFGIGTHLVTCQRQPALGCVYKLVEIEGNPCIKLSLDIGKVTIPGRKVVYRLFGQDGSALLDLIQRPSEPEPKAGERVLCRHPFEESKRAYVTPATVNVLLQKYWDRGEICMELPTLHDSRGRVRTSLQSIRSDVKRYLNPTPFKVSISAELYQYMHDLWLQNAPIGELC